MIYKQITKKHDEITSEINRLKTKLKEFPEKRLLCNPNGIYTQWHLTSILDIIPKLLIK